MRMSRPAKLTVPCGLLVLLTACHPANPPGVPTAAASATASNSASVKGRSGGSTLQASGQITYKPEVQVMETIAALESLKGQTHGGRGFLFDSKYAPAKALKAGDVLLIKGLLARKVIAAGETPDGIVVVTQNASITEVLKTGHIAMHSSMHFKPAAQHAENLQLHPDPQRWLEWLQTLIPVQSAKADIVGDGSIKLGGQDPLQMADHDVNAELHPASMTGQEISRTLDDIKESAESPYVKPFIGTLQDWEVKWSATPADGKLNLNLEMTKNLNGLIAKITGTGYIADFEFDNDMNIDSNSAGSAPPKSFLAKAEGQFKNVNGAMNFNWEIGKDTPGGESGAQSIKLPGAISQSLAPLLDGLPLTLQVSAAIVTHPMMTSGKQYSQGAFRVTYDGYQHFKMQGGSMTADGAMDGETSADVPRNLSAVAPFGIVIGFSAPQIDLVFGGDGMIQSEDIMKAAAYTDTIVDAAAKKLLSADAYQAYKDSDFSITDAAKKFNETNATLSMRIVTTSTMTEGGASQITPCSKSHIDFGVYVGASANAMGLAAGSTSKQVMNKSYEHINPPGTKLCANL
jgi:hypothetical protein